MLGRLPLLCLLVQQMLQHTSGFAHHYHHPSLGMSYNRPRTVVSLHESSKNDNSDNDKKFGMVQRIDSVKSLAWGAIVGSIAQSPISFLHDVILSSSSLAQWEWDCDSAAISAGLFAIVYRYCIRQDENPQLNQGVIGAFGIIRTVSRVQIPTYCTALPLQCGGGGGLPLPLGILDWSIIQQLVLSGAESVVLFGCTAVALDVAMAKGYISKFPN